MYFLVRRVGTDFVWNLWVMSFYRLINVLKFLHSLFED